MKTFKKLTMTAATAALGLGLVAPGHAALIIDDFNFTNIPPPPTTEADTSIGNPDRVSRLPSTGGTIMNGIAGWTRDELYARSWSGQDVTTADCYLCDQGVTSNDVNTTGQSFFSWTGPATDLSGLGPVQFSYSTDVPDGDVIISFSSNGGTSPVANGIIHLMDLADTNSVKQNISSALPGGDLTAINFVRIDVFSVGSTEQGNGFADTTVGGASYFAGLPNLGDTSERLDLTLDQVQRTPEPTTLVLLGLGAVGFGWSRTRRKA